MLAINWGLSALRVKMINRVTLPGKAAIHDRRDPVLDRDGNHLTYEGGEERYYFGDEALVGVPSLGTIPCGLASLVSLLRSRPCAAAARPTNGLDEPPCP